jgi:DNA topoisomerase-3
VGRVQTPTLAIVVERDQKIKASCPKGYWEVHATFGAQGGTYPGRWFKEDLPRTRKATMPSRALCGPRRGARAGGEMPRQAGHRHRGEKAATQMSPLLYDLTTLQREANGRLGLSAKGTLGLAQRLYEHHKVLTYPRTDSRALPEDYIDTVKHAAEC